MRSYSRALFLTILFPLDNLLLAHLNNRWLLCGGALYKLKRRNLFTNVVAEAYHKAMAAMSPAYELAF